MAIGFRSINHHPPLAKPLVQAVDVVVAAAANDNAPKVRLGGFLLAHRDRRTGQMRRSNQPINQHHTAALRQITAHICHAGTATVTTRTTIIVIAWFALEFDISQLQHNALPASASSRARRLFTTQTDNRKAIIINNKNAVVKVPSA